MARNEEKAQSMLYRFREAQAIELGHKKDEKRPYLASSVNSLSEAEKWRRQIIRDISRLTMKIQNITASDDAIRDLNDEINKLFREKRHWENRIKELGGSDYRKVASKIIDEDGKLVPGGGGYRYFGKARELPGVKKMFERELKEAKKKTKAELAKKIDSRYFGYYDENCAELLEHEARREKEFYDSHC